MQVYLSTRRGTWVINRVWHKGLPIDIKKTRLSIFLYSFLPARLTNYMREKQVQERFDHKLYGLQPGHRFSQQHPMINDDLPKQNHIREQSLSKQILSQLIFINVLL